MPEGGVGGADGLCAGGADAGDVVGGSDQAAGDQGDREVAEAVGDLEEGDAGEELDGVGLGAVDDLEAAVDGAAVLEEEAEDGGEAELSGEGDQVGADGDDAVEAVEGGDVAEAGVVVGQAVDEVEVEEDGEGAEGLAVEGLEHLREVGELGAADEEEGGGGAVAGRLWDAVGEVGDDGFREVGEEAGLEAARFHVADLRGGGVYCGGSQTIQDADTSGVGFVSRRA